MERLRKQILSSPALQTNVDLPANVWQLPEKVLQFGTGVLLRGLPDYFINKANNQDVFNGRVVMVKSTAKGDVTAYAEQDGLYTHCIKGIANGTTIESYTINAAISRVIDANNNWQEVLACAQNADLKIIISNTTEVGISLLETDTVNATPPQSFPGKLLSFLYARYSAFNGSGNSGMVIIPTELLVDNGGKLKEIVVQLARINVLSEAFINWLQTANDWCSSLVDRIVPGALPEEDADHLKQAFHCTDDLAIMSEPYSLWAIESGNKKTKEILSFADVNKGVVITPDIQKYRELKLRLLNATHTLSCGLAFLLGFETVNAAMNDAVFHHFVSGLMYNETIPCIVNSHIAEEEAKAFAADVISRFENPFIRHKWLAITMQYTGKIKQRCVPLLLRYYHLFSAPPRHTALGFAAYLLFAKATNGKNDKYYGEAAGENYWIQDDTAATLYEIWQTNNQDEVAEKVLSRTDLWGENLSLLPGFADAVNANLQQLIKGKPLEELLSA